MVFEKRLCSHGGGQARMTDIAYILVLVGFFCLCMLYTVGCERI